jgi:hypothetical protein
VSTPLQRHAGALRDVHEERLRQDELVRTGKIPWDCCDPTAPEGYKLAVLTEEIGEVARAILEHDDPAHLRQELIQTAAVAVAWAESIPVEQERAA